MKAVDFDYIRAASVQEVLDVISDLDRDVKILAGGQSLVPLLAMRLVRPALVVDVNHVQELAGFSCEGSYVKVGALTRQHAVETSPEIARLVPLLSKAIPFVAHRQIRVRGTVGGSIAHADPAAEIPLVSATLGAQLVLRSKVGSRTVDAGEFFIGPMITGLAPDELLTEIRYPVWSGEGAVGTGFQEVSIRSGDFAIVAACAQVMLDANGTCVRAAVGVGGAHPVPLRSESAAQCLLGTRIDGADARRAAELAAGEVDPSDDIHATADFRRHLTAVLVERAVREAKEEALRKLHERA